ncbi:carbonic anhydrase 7 [Lutzomyia longipalpis]|uniref:carbonic anhydrase 7 n=1 Tax=Lutzomyia longipalpis TaxID=7200 RepID=UPI00248335D2|nr:carbonic anhydrase 7 [Lutzomyia longipalpis]
MKNFCESASIHRIFLKFFIFLTIAERIHCQDFGYDGDKGPSHWGEQYNTCYGKHQSPINIDSLDVVPVNLPPLEFIGFDEQPANTKLSNNGHTVMLEVDSDPQPAISGGPLDCPYEFMQLHFHWGDNDTVGSEDLIDSRSFAMELHVVFYKSAYRNSRAALDHEDGLAVLAFFFEVSPYDNPNFVKFTDLLEQVRLPHTNATFVDPPTLRQLIGYDTTHYYTYNGSLTTPPCSEVVVWIDFKEPIALSHNQIEKFRALEDHEGAKMTHNFRPTQPIGDRVVLFNTDEIIENSLNKKWPPYDVVPEIPPPPHEAPTKPEDSNVEESIPDDVLTEPSNTLEEKSEKPQHMKKGLKRIFKKNSAWTIRTDSYLVLAISLPVLIISAAARV